MTTQPPTPHPKPHDDGAGPQAEGQQKVLAARLWIARHRPYYASALFSCPLWYTDQTDGFSIDAHWRISVNPAVAASLSVEEVAGSLAHELNHALRAHPDRGLRAGVPPDLHTLWNVAADCEINDDLSEDGLARRPGIIYPEDFGLPEGKLAETYYRHLLQNAETIEIPTACCTSATYGPDVAHPFPGLSAARKQQLKRATAQAVLDHQHQHGWWSATEGLARWAENTASPTADWRRILAAELRRGIQRQPGTGDRTYTRPPRRPDDSAVIRPGTHQPATDIAVVIDTSGSMQEPDLRQALAETEAVLKQTGGQQPITVHSHDTEARTTQRILNTSRIELDGGGGTDMAAAINTAATARPRPAIIIVITDGHTPWPPTRPTGNHSTIIAVLTRPHTAENVPCWITPITTTRP